LVIGARFPAPSLRGNRAPLLAALALAVGLGACSQQDPSTVRTATVARATVAEVVEAPGSVAARATATVSAPATGRVAELAVADGQLVTTGAVLLRIDSPQAQDQLAQAEQADAEVAKAGRVSLPSSNIAAEQRRADQAATDAFARARASAQSIPLDEARSQALVAVDTAEAQYAAARAQAQDAARRFEAGLGSLSGALSSIGDAQRVQTRAAVTLARKAVDSLTVLAPIDGVVSLGSGPGQGAAGAGGLLDQLPPEVAAQAGGSLGGGAGPSVRGSLAVGSPVSSGDVLVTVTDVSTLSLTAEVDETDVLLVTPGIEADVELDAVPGSRYPATVQSVDISPTSSSGGAVAYIVRLSLGAGTTAGGEPAPSPKPGMSAVVDLRVRTASDAVAAPASAVFRDGERDAVWLVVDGTVKRRQVVVGAQGEQSVEVVEGLAEGDRIVVGGADAVVEGQRLP
jgi:multidrug efflux pump subunit AcrA (membrane-fusion protein)